MISRVCLTMRAAMSFLPLLRPLRINAQQRRSTMGHWKTQKKNMRRKEGETHGETATIQKDNRQRRRCRARSQQESKDKRQTAQAWDQGLHCRHQVIAETLRWQAAALENHEDQLSSDPLHDTPVAILVTQGQRQQIYRRLPLKGCWWPIRL